MSLLGRPFPELIAAFTSSVDCFLPKFVISLACVRSKFVVVPKAARVGLEPTTYRLTAGCSTC